MGNASGHPVEGVMDSDFPSQSADRKCRAANLHLAGVADKEVMKEHAHWEHAQLRHTRKDPGASFVMYGGGPVPSA